MSLSDHFKLFPTLAVLVQRAERGPMFALLCLTILMAVFELLLALLVALLAKVISGGQLEVTSNLLRILQSSSEWMFGTNGNALVLGGLFALLITLLTRSIMQLFYQWHLTCGSD